MLSPGADVPGVLDAVDVWEGVLAERAFGLKVTSGGIRSLGIGSAAAARGMTIWQKTCIIARDKLMGILFILSILVKSASLCTVEVGKNLEAFVRLQE